MIIVTGGAGFIGSNLIKALNARGHADILAVDSLRDGRKYRNLVDCEIADYWDHQNFLRHIQQAREFEPVPEAIFHQGACTTTTEWDGEYMMNNNYEFSKCLLHYCQEREIPFLYASSASVYGTGSIFREERPFEAPLNVYGYSKFLFDQYVRRWLPMATGQIVGLRYFNAYGPREAHKDTMASVVYHFRNQLRTSGTVRLFAGSDGYADGEQRRDFVYVEDAVSVNLWFLDNPDASGIFNCGTGRSATFNEVAHTLIQWYGYGNIAYIPFPEHLHSCYQNFTEADMTTLRELGYDQPFLGIEAGIPRYLKWMEERMP